MEFFSKGSCTGILLQIDLPLQTDMCSVTKLFAGTFPGTDNAAGTSQYRDLAAKKAFSQNPQEKSASGCTAVCVAYRQAD